MSEPRTSGPSLPVVLHPFAHADVVAFSVVLGAFLLTAYLVVQSLTYHPPRNG